jgi:dihydroxy-acid dehydratase
MGRAARQPRATRNDRPAVGGDARLRRHAGRAVVFDSLDDLAARIDSPDLEVAADDVLVLRLRPRAPGAEAGPADPENARRVGTWCASRTRAWAARVRIDRPARRPRLRSGRTARAGAERRPISSIAARRIDLLVDTARARPPAGGARGDGSAAQRQF